MQVDKNGYAPSICQYDESRCIRCGRTSGKLDRHEVFHGANREKSKEKGLWVTLCHDCHMKLHHSGDGYDAKLKELCERDALHHYGWTVEDFIREFGKNYVEVEL